MQPSYFCRGRYLLWIIAIHDIPARIAEKRHHPHADAIHAAGWVSLFTLHVLWPFLWIWAACLNWTMVHNVQAITRVVCISWPFHWTTVQWTQGVSA